MPDTPALDLAALQALSGRLRHAITIARIRDDPTDLMRIAREAATALPALLARVADLQADNERLRTQMALWDDEERADAEGLRAHLAVLRRNADIDAADEDD